MPIAVIGMIDEREEALSLIRDRIEQRGHKALLMDVSIGTGAIVPSLKADIRHEELSKLGGGPEAGVADMLPDGREEAISIMARGLKKKILSLHESGELEGIIAISGMTGAMIALPSLKMAPFGLPKLLISSAMAMPIHAEQFAEYFSVKDITVMHAVVDTVGMNALVRTLALNGADAVSGMIEGDRTSSRDQKPSIALTEFGFCDKGAHYIRELLEKEYEIVSFHANGVGDKAVMELIPQGTFRAFVDLVPGAFSEYLLGGNRGITGPDRLDVARGMTIPYILCPGGFDIISCGPLERKDGDDTLWKSRKLVERKLYIQEHPRVQARLIAEEMELVASSVAERLNSYDHRERVSVIIPLRGFSSLSTEGGPLYDPESDRVFASTLKRCLNPEIEIREVETDINSREFAAVVTETLLRILKTQ